MFDCERSKKMLRFFLLSLVASVVNAQDGCKRVAELTASTGSFYSPYYEHFPAFYYPAGLRCRWSIKAPTGTNIKITISDPISINGRGYDCSGGSGDNLAVFAGGRPTTELPCESEAYIAGPFCPTTDSPVPPPPFVIGKDHIDIEFCTNDYQTGFHGFKIQYEMTSEAPTNIPVITPRPPPTTRAPVTCGGSITVTAAEPQYIQSPYYPAEYPNDITCTWEISGPSGLSLVFTPEAFAVELGESNNCNYDSVTITDRTVTGPTSNLGMYCGETLPFVTLETLGNRATVEFKTDIGSTRTGFRIKIGVSACPSGSGVCPSNTGAPVCFRRDQLCDGTPNCPGGGDENCPAGCGVPFNKPLISTRRAARIVGGIEAKPHSWPWQATLLHASNLAHTCGASIIDHHWLVTSAQCCQSVGAVAAYYKVRVGEHDLKGNLETSAFTYDVELLVSHPKYNPSTFENDICILKTKLPIFFNNDIHPICLGSGISPPVGKNCYVTGWGSTSTGTGPAATRLRQVDVLIADQEVCAKAYPVGVVKTDKICAYNPGKGSCTSDRGGPLVCPTQGEPTMWELVGIVSSQDRNACARPDVPGVYARVSRFLDWISETVLSNS